MGIENATLFRITNTSPSSTELKHIDVDLAIDSVMLLCPAIEGKKLSLIYNKGEAVNNGASFMLLKYYDTTKGNVEVVHFWN